VFEHDDLENHSGSGHLPPDVSHAHDMVADSAALVRRTEHIVVCFDVRVCGPHAGRSRVSKLTSLGKAMALLLGDFQARFEILPLDSLAATDMALLALVQLADITAVADHDSVPNVPMHLAKTLELLPRQFYPDCLEAAAQLPQKTRPCNSPSPCTALSEEQGGARFQVSTFLGLLAMQLSHRSHLDPP
jgi:hypothetical protein